MSFCTKCGKELAPDAVFCQHCGAKVQPVNKVYSVYMRGSEATNPSTQSVQTEQPAQQAVEQTVPQVEATPVVSQPAVQPIATPAMQAGRAKYCTHCGSLIDENAVVCVRCGCNTEVNKTPVKKKFNGMAIAGFVLSFFDYISVLGLIFSIIALVVINKKDQRGKGLAIAGLIISIVITLLVAISLVEDFSNGVEFASTIFNLK